MEKQQAVLDALFARRSIRSYTDEPVSAQDIETIIRAGMFAPSAHNQRSWAFITVQDRQKLIELANCCKYWKMLNEAPLAIACCAECEETDAESRTYLLHNVCAATENMLLAIHGLGLGGVWLNASPQRDFYKTATAALGIPETVELVAVLAVGHPAPDQPPRRMPERFEPEKWHKERW